MFLARFRDGSAVKTINEQTLEKVYLDLAPADLAEATKKKWWGFYKRFVDYLYQSNLIEMPRNLKSRNLSFRAQTKAVKTWPLSVVRQALKDLPDKFRCWVLLGLNC